MQNPDSQEIVERFFTALDMLKDHKVLKAYVNFTDRHNINRRHLYILRKDPHRMMFQVAWLKYLVEDYNVSAEWLLTGNGKRYKSDNQAQHKG